MHDKHKFYRFVAVYSQCLSTNLMTVSAPMLLHAPPSSLSSAHTAILHHHSGPWPRTDTSVVSDPWSTLLWSVWWKKTLPTQKWFTGNRQGSRGSLRLVNGSILNSLNDLVVHLQRIHFWDSSGALSWLLHELLLPIAMLVWCVSVLADLRTLSDYGRLTPIDVAHARTRKGSRHQLASAAYVGYD